MWFAACAATFLGLRALFVPVGQFNLLNDSFDYLYVAQTLGDGADAAARPYYRPVDVPFIPRPLGFPLILRLCGVRDQDDAPAFARVAWLQFATSSLAFAYAAWVCARYACHTRAARLLVVLGLLTLSGTEYAATWDSLILTESLAVACQVALLAAVIAALAAPSVKAAGGAALALIASVALRDANVLLPLCVPLALWPFAYFGAPSNRGTLRGSLALIAAACIALTVTATLSASRGRRGDVNLTNMLALRVWTDGANFDAFVRDTGLPATVQPLVGKPAWQGWQRDSDYVTWLQARGCSAYFGFLAGHPDFAARLFVQSLKDRAAELASGGLAGYADLQGYRPLATPQVQRCTALSRGLARGPTWLQQQLGWSGSWIVLGALAGAGLIVQVARGARGVAVAIWLGGLIVITQLLLVTFGDAFEQHRHALVAFLVMWMLALIGLSSLVDVVGGRKHRERAASATTGVVASPDR